MISTFLVMLLPPQVHLESSWLLDLTAILFYLTFSGGLTNNQELFTDNKLAYAPISDTLATNINGQSVAARQRLLISSTQPILPKFLYWRPTRYTNANSSSYVSRATRGPGQFSFNKILEMLLVTALPSNASNGLLVMVRI